MGDPAFHSSPSEFPETGGEGLAPAGQSDSIRPDERAYLEKHALKKPLGVLDIWALGVGVVVAGAFTGWNLGLKGNGPVAVLIASLLVCLLYLAWVLALAELSVAMPFAGGPMAYGRRTANPLLGFVMGWSMFLEAQFAAIGVAIGAGGYIAFLVNPDHPDDGIALLAGLLVVAFFYFLQAWGVKEQSLAMVIMTYGSLAGLGLFWIVALSHFSWTRVWPAPDLFSGQGWLAAFRAIPYALWWLVMIEAVALAAEEAHEPERTIPRGLAWAQMTLIGLVLLTWFCACGALDYSKIATDAQGEDITYPLAEVIRRIPAGQSPFLLYGVGVLALFGLVASYHGILYGASRQLFALGRAGYLPAPLGRVHGRRRTPEIALALSSLIAAGFVVANYWYAKAISVSVLVSTLTALVWYILAMICLHVLRRREPGLFSSYRAPVSRILPAFVILMSLLAGFMFAYQEDAKTVLGLSLLLYGGGLAYFLLHRRTRVITAAPEELAVRYSDINDTLRCHTGAPEGHGGLLEWLAGVLLVLVIASLGWVIGLTLFPSWGRLASEQLEAVVVLALISAALLLVSLLALRNTSDKD